jgi:uncharacterized membrane protein
MAKFVFLFIKNQISFMILDLIITFLFSISPLGEGRVGIPYGITSGLNPLLTFFVSLGGNLMVFPLFSYIMKLSNKHLWKSRRYKKSAVYLTRKAKKGTQSNIQKYGIWGLMVFVMIPLPITGAYSGTIAAFVMQMNYKKSFFAVSVGVTIALIITTVVTYYAKLGLT